MKQKYMPHIELPLLAIALLMVVSALIQTGTNFLAASSYLAMLAGTASVMAVVRYWRYSD